MIYIAPESEVKDEIVAKKIALLLVESKAKIDEIDYIFRAAKSFLIVGTVEGID